MPKQVCQHSTAQIIVTGKIRKVLYVNFECLFWPWLIKSMRTLQPCFYFLNDFSKALIWHKAEEYVLKQSGSIALHNRVCYLNSVYMHMNCTMITNHAHACTNPLPPIESKKIGFIAPILKFPSAKISKTINMLCKHGTANVNNS